MQKKKSANNVSAAYDAIIELFDKLKPFTTRLELHERSGDVPALYQALVVKIFGKILVVCGQSTKLIREGRISEFLPVAPWLSFAQKMVMNYKG